MNDFEAVEFFNSIDGENIIMIFPQQTVDFYELREAIEELVESDEEMDFEEIVYKVVEDLYGNEYGTLEPEQIMVY